MASELVASNVTELARAARDDVEMTALVSAVVTTGDISRLDHKQRVWYYRHRCESLGLDPASKPFDVLRLSGKEILYLNKGGTDQLAKIHRVNRRIVDGPKVIDLQGTKMVFCVVEASTPDGRTEQEVATVPLADPLNALMKCASKAKRRATIAITGAAALDESELETIPESAKQLAPGIELDPSGAGESPELGEHAALAELRDRLAQDGVVPSFDALVQAFHETVGALDADDGGAKAAGLRACYAHLEETLGQKGQRGKFKSAVDALETARAAQKRATAQPAPASAPAVDPVEQAVADYARARSRDEVDAIAADCARLKLAKGSPAYKRLAEAYKAAVARLAPPPTDGPDGPQGGPKPANDPPAEDPADAAERAAIEAQDGASARAGDWPRTLAGFAGHLAADKHSVREVVNSTKAHAHELGARMAAVVDVVRRRLMALGTGMHETDAERMAERAVKFAFARGALQIATNNRKVA